MAKFEISVRLGSPVSVVFDFFRDPFNRSLVSPPGAGMVIVSGPNPLHVGSVIEFKVQGMGLVQQLSHEIVELEEHSMMLERQVKGPLKSFIHRHRFISDGESQTTLIDELEFEPPGGILGLLVTEDKLLDNFEDGFYYRNLELGKRFGTIA